MSCSTFCRRSVGEAALFLLLRHLSYFGDTVLSMLLDDQRSLGNTVAFLLL